MSTERLAVQQQAAAKSWPRFYTDVSAAGLTGATALWQRWLDAGRLAPEDQLLHPTTRRLQRPTDLLAELPRRVLAYVWHPINARIKNDGRRRTRRAAGRGRPVPSSRPMKLTLASIDASSPSGAYRRDHWIPYPSVELCIRTQLHAVWRFSQAPAAGVDHARRPAAHPSPQAISRYCRSRLF